MSPAMARTTSTTAPGVEIDWSAVAAGLRPLAVALAGRGLDADELIQRCVVRLLTKAPERAEAGAFARRVMLRIWLDEQRSFGRRLARVAAAARRRPEKVADACSAADRETLDAVRGAIERLAPVQRAVFVMRIVEELSFEQIGAALDISPGAVRASLHLARRRLRAMLEEHP